MAGVPKLTVRAGRRVSGGRGAGGVLAKKGRARYSLAPMEARSPWGGQGSRRPARRPQPVRDGPHPKGPRPDLDRDQDRRADQRLGRRKLRSINTICPACWPTNAGSQALVGREIMAKKAIPADVQQRAVEVVERFNREVFGGDRICYVPRFKGAFLYLDRQGAGALGPICRLKYTGSFEKWEFAIFKYSSMIYDSHAWMFSGSQFIDGTIEGAMKAGMEAYPG